MTKSLKCAALISLVSVMALTACDYSGFSNASQWNYVEVNNAYYKEERTAGRGLRKVLTAMAPVKKVVLEAISDKTPPDILAQTEINTTADIATSTARVSKYVPLEYGELNFYSTRPNKDKDIHITKERAELSIAQPLENSDNSEPTQSLEIIQHKKIDEVDKTVNNNGATSLKKADFLFNDFAKIAK